MSGVEVLGIVLGVVPLLISGLEYYADGISTIKDMWQYEATLNHILNEFNLAQGIFQHSTQELLMPILPDDQVAELLKGRSPRWEDPNLDQQLQKRLGSDYQIYMRAVRTLHRQIKLLVRKLALDENTLLPPWMSSNKSVDKGQRDKFFRHTWQRVKLGFDKSRLDVLLTDIKNGINQIDKFTRGSIAVAPKVRAFERRTNAKYWLKIRNQAKALFDGLSSRWDCTCQYPHRASLRVDLREVPTHSEEQDIVFGMMFSFQVDSHNQNLLQLPWNWRDMNVTGKPVTQDDNRPSSSTVRGVSFNVPNRPRVGLPQITTVSTSQQPDVGSPIQDFCQTLKKTSVSKACVGYISDDICHHRFYNPNNDGRRNGSLEILSFYDVLKFKAKYGLGPKDRYALALTVASAVLQLHATPWLPDEWRLKDLHFAQHDPGLPLAKRTYLSKSFLSPNTLALTPSQTPPGTALRRPCVPNESMFALGLALIEISFGAPILSLKEEDDLDVPGFTEFFIASRLVEENAIKARDHDKYAEVVLRCVRGQLSVVSTPLSLEETKVLQSFYDDIIVPLKEINDSLRSNDSTT